MNYRLTLNIEGQAGETDRIITLDATGSPPHSTDPWRVKAVFGRPVVDVEASIEVHGPMGGILVGTFSSGDYVSLTGSDGIAGAGRLDARFRVSESSGRFAESTGEIRLYGTLEAQRVLLSVDLELDAPETAWRPPGAVLLSELAAGGAGAPESAAALDAERDSERNIIEGATPPNAPQRKSGSDRA